MGDSPPTERTSPQLLLILAAAAVVALFAFSCARSVAGTPDDSAAPAAGSGEQAPVPSSAIPPASADDATPGRGFGDLIRLLEAAALLGEVPDVVPDAPEVMPRVDTDDERLFMVGDSVLLAVSPTVEEMLPSWEVTADGEVGRGVAEGRGVVWERRSEIGDVAVVVLGHNYDKGGGVRSELDRIWRTRRQGASVAGRVPVESAAAPAAGEDGA